jgi:hypothetical protein
MVQPAQQEPQEPQVQRVKMEQQVQLELQVLPALLDQMEQPAQLVLLD